MIALIKLLSICQFGLPLWQGNLFEDNFDNNKNEWTIKNQWYRDYSDITGPTVIKIGVDYLSPTKEIKSQNSDFELPYQMIREMVDMLSKQLDVVMWIATSPDGQRRIKIKDDKIAFLQNDEYAYCLKFSNFIFQYMFGFLNYLSDEPISYNDLVHAMKSKSIIGMQFETSARIHNFSWQDVTSQ